MAKNRIIWVIAIVAAAALIYFMYSDIGGRTLKEIAEPTDLSKEEEGKGLDITFYDYDESTGKCHKIYSKRRNDCRLRDSTKRRDSDRI